MFDIVVVALLLALAVVAVSRFPAEGRSASTRFMISKSKDSPLCSACRAAVHESDAHCGTCGQVLV